MRLFVVIQFLLCQSSTKFVEGSRPLQQKRQSENFGESSQICNGIKTKPSVLFASANQLWQMKTFHP